MISPILSKDLISSTTELTEKILLNPETGLSLENLGCIGLPVGCHPTCTTSLKKATAKPISNIGAIMITDSSIISRNAIFASVCGIFPCQKVTTSGIFS
jgi:hypothetical protein